MSLKITVDKSPTPTLKLVGRLDTDTAPQLDGELNKVLGRKDIKRLASENGVKILYSRPVRGSRTMRSREAHNVDDTIAGHAMHYSTLGYTVREIAQLLELSVRDVWNIGKAYRFEFKNTPAGDLDMPSDSHASTPGNKQIHNPLSHEAESSGSSPEEEYN